MPVPKLALPLNHGLLHLPGQADDLYYQNGHAPNPLLASPNGRIETFPSGWVTNSNTISTGLACFSEFTAPANFTAATLQAWVDTALVVGGGSTSHCQLGLFSVAAGVYTLLAASTDDTTCTMLLSAGLASKTITGTPIVKGTRYAVGIAAVFAGQTTAPKLAAAVSNVSSGFSSKTGFPTLGMQTASVNAGFVGPYTGAATIRVYWFGLGN